MNKANAQRPLPPLLTTPFCVLSFGPLGHNLSYISPDIVHPFYAGPPSGAFSRSIHVVWYFKPVADRGVSGPWGPQFYGALCRGVTQRFPVGGLANLFWQQYIENWLKIR